jgi:hypothetical protein
MGRFSEWQPRYSEHGIPTFPVVIDDKGRKKPAVKGYLKLGCAVSRRLASKFAEHDALGFALGKRSGITVLDVDCHDERILADAMARHGPTPIIVRSGGGNWQAWYRHNGEGRKVRLWPDLPIDLLGCGYIVAPPSQGTCRAYEMVAGSLDDLTRLPMLTGLESVPASSAIREDIGHRNCELFRFCLTVARGCPSLDRLLVAGRARNGEFSPPLSDDEVIRTAKSAWRYTQDGNNWFGQGGMAALPFFAVDQLAASAPDAFALLAILKRHHGGFRDQFAIANAMAESLGWTLPRLKRARRQLLSGGFVRCVQEGRHGPHDPPMYAWSGGTMSYPNTNTRPPAPPIPLLRLGLQGEILSKPRRTGRVRPQSEHSRGKKVWGYASPPDANSATSERRSQCH